MKRLAISATFVGSNLIASLLIVAIVNRDAAMADSAGFFLFQAVLFPLIAFLSQSHMYMRFRGARLGLIGFALDCFSVVAAFAFLYFQAQDLITTSGMALYALSVPLTYRAAVSLAGIQFDRDKAIFALAPLATAIARVLGCFAALPFGIEWAFFVSSALYFVLPTSIGLLSQRSNTAETPEHASFWSFAWLFAYVIAAALMFMWDRPVLQGMNATEFIIASGIFMTWALSPISAVFATIYRSEARAIFRPSSDAFDWRAYRRRAALFIGIIAGYAALVAICWEPVNKLAFPAFEGSVWLVLILIAALVADRLGTMTVFMLNRIEVYRAASFVKFAIIAIAITAAVGIGDMPSLERIYAIYLGAALVFVTCMIVGAKWFVRR